MADPRNGPEWSRPVDTSGSQPLEITMTPTPQRRDDAPLSFSAPDLRKKRDDSPLSFGGAEADVGDRGPLSNEPDESDLSSLGKGAGTIIARGLSHIPGMLGDYRDFGKFAVRGAHSVLSGRPFADVWKEGEKNEQRLRAKGDLPPQAPSGEEFFQRYVKPYTGEYEATTRPGKWTMQAGEAGLSMLSPQGGVVKGGKMVAEPAVNLAKSILKQGPKSVPIGAVAGGAGAVVGDVTENPALALAASILAPVATHVGAVPVKKYVAPMFSGNHESLAAERLLHTTTDPEEALKKLNDPHQMIPGSNPTMAQVTGDIAQGQAEKLGRVENPAFRSALVEKEGGQDKARRGVIGVLSDPKADPTEVSKAFQRHLEAVEAQQADVAALGQEAEKHGNAIPSDLTPEGTGAALRGEAKEPAPGTVAAQKAAAAGLLDKLKKSIDPEGKMNIVAEGVPAAANKITKEVNPDLPPTKMASPIATPVLDMAKQLKSVMPFSAMVDFDQTITSAMKQAAKADDWTGHNQLSTLKGAVKKSINEALENQHTWEQGALARGEIRQEDMLAHNLQRHIDDWREARSAGSGAGAGAPTARAVGEGGVPPVAGGTGETSAGPGPLPPGAGAVPGELAPNIDPEAAQRLTLFNKGWGAHKDLYDPLEGALDKKPMGGGYEMDAAKVPADAFKSGDTGYTRAQQWMRGANNSPESIKSMQDIATMRLREAMGADEVLTQKELDAWKSRYGNALRAIDEVTPGFSSRFDNAATATTAFEQATIAQREAMREAQKGVAAKFLGLEHPDDVTRVVGGMMNAKDSGRQLTALVDRLKNEPAALEGVKKAVSDWMLHDLSTAKVGPDNESMLSGVRMIDFVHENPSAIKVLYGDEGLAFMQQVSGDLKRAQRVISNYATAQGSDTANYLLPYLKQAEQSGGHGGTWSTMLPIIGWEMLHEGGLSGIFSKEGALMAGGIVAKEVARRLHLNGMGAVNKLYLRGLEDPEFGKLLLQRAVDEHGRLDTTTLEKLQRYLTRQVPLAVRASESVQQGETEREGRAAGGKVAIDHEAEAERLINLAEKARRNLGTEPLLEQPDERIVKALAIANSAARGVTA